MATSMWLVGLLGLAIACWALIDCAIRPARAFPAAERQTKSAWLIFLGIALIVQYFWGVVSLLGIAAIIVSVYYLADVRAKVAGIRR